MPATRKTKKNDGERIECCFCSRFVPVGELDRHSPCPWLPKRLRFQDAPLQCATDLKLRPCQLAALEHVRRFAEVASQQTLASSALQQRLEALKVSRVEFQETLRYVRDVAPLIIHIRDADLAALANDTHYRNQFETGTSRGMLSFEFRAGWETSMFGAAYDKATGEQRCKYGCVHFHGSTEGNLRAAPQYGHHFFILRPEVRARTTLCAGDSCRNPPMGDLNHCAHILLSLTDNLLLELIHVACRGARMTGTSQSEDVYIETQFHGPIELDKHVETLVLNEDTDLAQKFVKRGIAVVVAPPSGSTMSFFFLKEKR